MKSLLRMLLPGVALCVGTFALVAFGVAQDRAPAAPPAPVSAPAAYAHAAPSDQAAQDAYAAYRAKTPRVDRAELQGSIYNRAGHTCEAGGVQCRICGAPMAAPGPRVIYAEPIVYAEAYFQQAPRAIVPVPPSATLYVDPATAAWPYRVNPIPYPESRDNGRGGKHRRD